MELRDFPFPTREILVTIYYYFINFFNSEKTKERPGLWFGLSLLMFRVLTWFLLRLSQLAFVIYITWR